MTLPPDRTRLLPLSFGRMFVADLGPVDSERPPIVLLHGLLVTHYAFRHVVPLLWRDRRVIALDLPGCGESDRPAPRLADDYSLTWIAARVGEALQALDLPRVDLCGHSFGGSVALRIAGTAAHRVRRLVLVDPVAFPFALPLRGRLALLPRVGPLLFENVYRRADLHRYLERTFSTPELVDATAVDVYWDRLGREGGREATHAMLRTLARLEGLSDLFARVTAPTLVVWGDRDVLMPSDDADRLVAALPDARLVTMPGCGHAVPEERPTALVGLMREFLAEPPS